MVAMAGKYVVYIEKSKLILTHPAGSRFDLTREDAMQLAVLISNWQRAVEMGLYERRPEAMQMGEDEETTTIELDENTSNSAEGISSL